MLTGEILKGQSKSKENKQPQVCSEKSQSIGMKGRMWKKYIGTVPLYWYFFVFILRSLVCLTLSTLILNTSIWNLIFGMRALLCGQTNKVIRVFVISLIKIRTDMGHFCPYSIVPTYKYVRKALKTQKRNWCQKSRFATNSIFWQMLLCFIFLIVMWFETNKKSQAGCILKLGYLGFHFFCAHWSQCLLSFLFTETCSSSYYSSFAALKCFLTCLFHRWKWQVHDQSDFQLNVQGTECVVDLLVSFAGNGIAVISFVGVKIQSKIKKARWLFLIDWESLEPLFHPKFPSRKEPRYSG